MQTEKESMHLQWGMGEGVAWGVSRMGQLTLSKGLARIGIRYHVQRAAIPRGFFSSKQLMYSTFIHTNF